MGVSGFGNALSGFGGVSGFRLLRLMAITMKIKMIAATVMTMASTSPNDIADGIGGTANCIVTWCMLKCVVNHT
jgi:hypothetical protein